MWPSMFEPSRGGKPRILDMFECVTIPGTRQEEHTDNLQDALVLGEIYMVDIHLLGVRTTKHVCVDK